MRNGRLREGEIELLIGLSGFARSGKDTVAGMLMGVHGFDNIAFANKIKDLLYQTNPLVWVGEGYTLYVQDIVDDIGWEDAKAVKDVRRLLQKTGVAARDLFGESFWIDQVLGGLDLNKKYVITDVRFNNEADKIKSLGGQLWRINRPGVGPANSHVSENGMTDYPFDAVIENDKDMQRLLDQVGSLLK